MNKQELIEKIAGKHYCSTDTAAMILESIDAEGWLRNPDQVPGRTITESELEGLNEALPPSAQLKIWVLKKIAETLGHSVVPDPEPTEAEKLAEIISEYTYHSEPQALAEALARAGVKAPGDEENAEHDLAWWIENANVNDAEDCEACVDDLCPVHHGIALGIDFVTKKIAALGDDPELFNSIPSPPKAPGGDYER